MQLKQSPTIKSENLFFRKICLKTFLPYFQGTQLIFSAKNSRFYSETQKTLEKKTTFVMNLNRQLNMRRINCAMKTDHLYFVSDQLGNPALPGLLYSYSSRLPALYCKLRCYLFFSVFKWTHSIQNLKTKLVIKILGMIGQTNKQTDKQRLQFYIYIDIV